jgi:hypothetical protein
MITYLPDTPSPSPQQWYWDANGNNRQKNLLIKHADHPFLTSIVVAQLPNQRPEINEAILDIVIRYVANLARGSV